MIAVIAPTIIIESTPNILSESEFEFEFELELEFESELSPDPRFISPPLVLLIPSSSSSPDCSFGCSSVSWSVGWSVDWSVDWSAGLVVA